MFFLFKYIYLISLSLATISYVFLSSLYASLLFSSHLSLEYSLFPRISFRIWLLNFPLHFSHMFLFLSIYPSHLPLSLASFSPAVFVSRIYLFDSPLSFLPPLSPSRFSSWFHSRVGGFSSLLFAFPRVPSRIYLLQQNPRPTIYPHQNFTQTAYFTTV